MRIRLPLLPTSIRWLGVFMVAGFIFYNSIITVPPDVGVSEDVFGLLADIVGFAQDKWRHFVAYGTLAYSLAYATDDWNLRRWRRALLVIALVAFYGIGIEIWQYFLPYRFFDLNDILANTLGACLIIPWYLLRPSIEFASVRELVSEPLG